MLCGQYVFIFFIVLWLWHLWVCILAQKGFPSLCQLLWFTFSMNILMRKSLITALECSQCYSNPGGTLHLCNEKTLMSGFVLQILMPSQPDVQPTVCKLCRWEVYIATLSHHDSRPLQHRGPCGPQMGSQKFGDPYNVGGKDSWTISDSGDVSLSGYLFVHPRFLVLLWTKLMVLC